MLCTINRVMIRTSDGVHESCGESVIPQILRTEGMCVCVRARVFYAVIFPSFASVPEQYFYTETTLRARHVIRYAIFFDAGNKKIIRDLL